MQTSPSPSSPVPFELPYCPGERRHRFNILLVVVDNLRADHLPAWGYERDTTPLLSRRLASSTMFKNCHSPVGWTLPGCASIVTGQMPDDHGLVDHNNKFRKPKLGHFLGSDYYRAAIANNGNVVTDSISLETLEQLGLTKRPAKWRFFNWDDGFDDYSWFPREQHLAPYETVCKLLDKMPRQASGSDQPWFLFFHTNIVHDYHMGRDFYLETAEWLGEEIRSPLVAVPDGPEIWSAPPPGVDQDVQVKQLVAKYDAGIRETDRKLDELFSRVNFDETIVVFVSDHGEGFEPQVGRVHHCGRLHNDLTHVPLAVWLPPPLQREYEALPEQRRFCSTIDIVPTLLTLLGDTVAGFPGRFLFDLPVHRRIEGSDRGYVYWNQDCKRESYDTARIEIRSEITFPLKSISMRKNDSVREYAYNLAYDPQEQENLLGPLATRCANFEPITFVVAVNDEEELRNNFLRSPVACRQEHEWILVDNPGNQNYANISALYQRALEQAQHDLVFFIHQDVLLPLGWETRMFHSLRELEKDDRNWGVIGAVGALPLQQGKTKELRGHWCDPSGYYYRRPLPHEVQSLDEQWLGLRRGRGVHFDPKLPGFHCYGMDLSLTAREMGLKSYALDAFVWHKFHDTQGYLVGRPQDSDKIRRRWSEQFMAEFQPSADYVEAKWKKYLPFQTTSWNWGNP